MNQMELAVVGLKRAGITRKDAERILTAVDITDPRYFLMIMTARPIRAGDMIAIHGDGEKVQTYVEVVDFQEALGERMAVVGYRKDAE